MVKLQHNNKQFTLTISSEHIKKMKWKKGDELYIAKYPDEDRLYLEKMNIRKKKK